MLVRWVFQIFTIGSLGVHQQAVHGAADVPGGVEQHHLGLLVAGAEAGGGRLDLLHEVGDVGVSQLPGTDQLLPGLSGGGQQRLDIAHQDLGQLQDVVPVVGEVLLVVLTVQCAGPSEHDGGVQTVDDSTERGGQVIQGLSSLIKY